MLEIITMITPPANAAATDAHSVIFPLQSYLALFDRSMMLVPFLDAPNKTLCPVRSLPSPVYNDTRKWPARHPEG